MEANITQQKQKAAMVRHKENRKVKKDQMIRGTENKETGEENDTLAEQVTQDSEWKQKAAEARGDQ